MRIFLLLALFAGTCLAQAPKDGAVKGGAPPMAVKAAAARIAPAVD